MVAQVTVVTEQQLVGVTAAVAHLARLVQVRQDGALAEARRQAGGPYKTDSSSTARRAAKKRRVSVPACLPTRLKERERSDWPRFPCLPPSLRAHSLGVDLVGVEHGPRGGERQGHEVLVGEPDVDPELEHALLLHRVRPDHHKTDEEEEEDVSSSTNQAVRSA